MKNTCSATLAVLITFASMIPSAASSAAAIDSIQLTVNFEVSKCNLTSSEDGTSASTCDSAASLNQPISISMNNCSTTGAFISCYGRWNTSRDRDGHSFASSITAEKKSYDGGTTFSYVLTASAGSVANTQGPTYVHVSIGPTGTLTDAIRFSGSPLFIPETSTESLLYTPSMFIGPKP